MGRPRKLCPAGKEVVAWLEANERTQQWLTDEIGAPGRAMLWRWLVGERVPTIKYASAIQKVTGVEIARWDQSSTTRKAS